MSKQNIKKNTNQNTNKNIPVDLIISARWVIPMDLDLDLDQTQPAKYLDHASVAILDGKISAIGPTDFILNHYTAPEIIQKPNHVLLPGLINSHTHLPMSLLRGIADDLPLMTWLKENIWPAETGCVSPSFVQDGTELALLELIKGGVTCVNDMYFFAETIADCIQKSGIRGFVANSILNIPMPWIQNLEDCFSQARALCTLLSDTQTYSLVKPTIAPHAPYTNTEESLKQVKNLATEFDTPIHMHVQETLAEIHQHDLLYKERPLQTLHRLGLLSSRLLAVHMTQISESDLELLKKTNPSVIHCPESNMKLASGASPISLLLKNKINVALGTDGAASNNNLDMFGEMRSAALMAKLIDDNPESLSAYEVLSMATINGAKALNISDITGSLRPGKSADFILINLQDPSTTPVYNPISQIVYAAHSHQVTDSWVAGRQILKDKNTLTLNQNLILKKAENWKEKIQNLIK